MVKEAGSNNRDQQKRKQIVSNSLKAGITFPVGRVRRHLKAGAYSKRIGIGGSVFMAAVLEYLVAEILELGGEACKANRKQRVTPRHLQLAIRNDTELSALLQNITIPGGGVLPHIEPSLLKKLTRSRVVAPVENSQQQINGNAPLHDPNQKRNNSTATIDNNETNDETNDDDDEQLEESVEI